MLSVLRLGYYLVSKKMSYSALTRVRAYPIVVSGHHLIANIGHRPFNMVGPDGAAVISTLICLLSGLHLGNSSNNAVGCHGPLYLPAF